MKKIALFVCIALFIGCMIPIAATAETIKVEYEVLGQHPERTPGVDCYEVLDNTGFEILDSPEKLYAWGISSYLGKEKSGLGSKVADRSDDAHGGSYALKLMTEKPGQQVNYAHALCAVSIKAGETYELSAWVKKIADCERIVLQSEFSGSFNGIAQSYSRLNLSFDSVKTDDGWVKKVARFTAPEHVKQMTILLRLMGKGEVLWDDVSLLHITDKMPEPKTDPVKEALEYINLPNPGLEEDAPGQAPNPANGWTGLFDAKVSDKYSHSGNNSIELRIGPGQTDALIETYVTGFKNGATYQLSGWVYNPEELKVHVSFWVEYCSQDTFTYDESAKLGLAKNTWVTRKTEDWKRYVLEFTPPENTRSAVVQIRLRVTQGVFYGDDISLYMVEEPDAVNASTDETFYYSEWKEGYCEAKPYALKDPYNAKAEFFLIEPDGTESHKQTFDSIGEGVKYKFRTEWMAEKGKRYHIGMKIYGPDGAVLQEEKFPVFRFDRPTYLGADGIFRKNGKEYTITFGTGGQIDTINLHPEEGGVTVVLLEGDTHIPYKERMDMAYKQGLLCMINLGTPSACAGNKDRIENTKEVVTLLKDHPALFGYKVQDEPFQKHHPDEEMITAYEIIRNIDPHHAVYVDDSVLGSYPWLYRYSDIMDIDYYGAANKDAGRIMSDVMDRAMEASKGRKPFTVLQQAFVNGGYLASVDELRHIAYQSFFSGVAGYGFHSLASDDGIQPMYMTRPEWQENVEKWAPWERDFMYGCFVTGDYTFVNYSKTEDILWGTFTDGTDLYAICLNREKSAPKSAVIPLSDGMGTFKIGNYTAKTMTGEEKTLSGNGTLSLDLAPMEAVVWKVTPSEKMDFSHLKSSKYRDTLSYPWAYNAIATLEEKGIINEMSYNWYGPGEKITRGDYAMFLVRTLG
ncbi:MAG: S-layer homology domain-containing protein, partial [Clostridia bacterium]|nr:S-layer homology domain-containing protein [Clostridia bacterium]